MADPKFANLDGTQVPRATARKMEDDYYALRTQNFSSLVPERHNAIELTYVTAGNGIGEIATVVYKLDATVVGTLTLSYNASNKLSGVVRS